MSEKMLDRIRQVFISVIPGVDLAKLQDDTTLASFGIDSLDEVELILEIEEEFDIEIPDDDISQFKTFGNLCRYVENALGGKGSCG